jgi:hypothetical protein
MCEGMSYIMATAKGGIAVPVCPGNTMLVVLIGAATLA